ncbi:MAG: gluconate 2-dehydrogenase subunit 3 family protein [Chitinophagaceae bacterium]|nr:gluconate 2-dehydrogenase subunit 3 family protein [Chitinophagaceae bacterium]
MNRREALSAVGVLFGTAIIGGDVFLSGCKSPGKRSGLFSDKDILFLDEIGETIMPETKNSPGARSVKIGEFMKKIVTDCYTEKDQKIFTDGINKVNERSKKQYNEIFTGIGAEQKLALLNQLDKEANDYAKHKKKEEPGHYFTMMKQLSVWGYFSSEQGATKALRYLAIPGRYQGVIDYKKGDKAWAT